MKSKETQGMTQFLSFTTPVWKRSFYKGKRVIAPYLSLATVTTIAKRCHLSQFPQTSTDPSRPPITSSEPTSSLYPLITPITQKDLMMMGINSATFTSLLLYTYYVLIYWTLNRSSAKTDHETKVFFLQISFFTYGEWYFQKSSLVLWSV